VGGEKRGQIPSFFRGRKIAIYFNQKEVHFYGKKRGRRPKQHPSSWEKRGAKIHHWRSTDF